MSAARKRPGPLPLPLPSPRRLAAVAAALLCLCAAPAGAAAAGAPAPAPAVGDDAPAEPFLAHPPALVHFVAAELPPDTPFPAPEVGVVLRLDVSETGAVLAVALVEAAGPPFDAAAHEAARGFRFEPGRLDTGEAVPVEVTYRYVFTAPPPPPPAPVRVAGLLRERGTRKALGGVTVAARTEGRTVASAVTDGEGRFAFEVPAATFRLVAAPDGHEPLDALVEAVPGEEREETFSLERTGHGLVIVVQAERVRREVTKRVVPQAVVRTAPGTGGDTLKIVQSLPGVARTSFDYGMDLVLRGANPGDSKVFVEGIEVPVAYHFGGLRSVLNSRFLDRLDFVPGNFSAEFGRATGGVVDLRVRNPADDLFRGEIDLNLYDAGFALEGPLGGGWSMGGAFHRSYVDAILPLVLPDDASLSFRTAPRYYDYQLVTTWRPQGEGRGDHELRFLWFGSMDRMVAVQEDPGEDPALRGELGLRLMFHVVGVQYRARVAPWLRQESQLSFGWLRFQGAFGPELEFAEDWLPLALRSTWTAEAADWLTLRAGLDTVLSWGRGRITAISPAKEGEEPVPVAVQDRFSTDLRSFDPTPGGFVEATFRPHETVALTPSVRLDWFPDIERFVADPRFVARWEVLPGAALKAGAGLYQMAPDGDESNAAFGTPDLLPERAVQTSLGLEQAIGDHVRLEVTGFYKWLDRLVVRNPAAAWDPTADTYTNDGSGRVQGVELMLRVDVTDWFHGWLAYTYQRTWRRDQPGGESRPMDFDQPHLLTALGTFELGRGWTAGFRFRFVSGNPETAVERAVHDTGTGTWVAVHGAPNRLRLPDFHQLDLRIDKTWTFELWKLNLYLEVQNVYNRGNPEAYTYSYDYRERGTLTGLPILPIFGIRGEW